MSGYKRALVRISQEEYRRLHDADMQRKFTISKQTRKLVSVTDLTQTNHVERQSRENAQFEQILSQMNHEISNLERATQEEFNLQQNQFRNKIKEYTSEFLEQQDSISQLAATFQGRIEQESYLREKHQQQTNQLISNLMDAEGAKGDGARTWISVAHELGHFLYKQSSMEKFLPGRINFPMRELNLSISNFRNGFYEAALTSAQRAYLELSDLRLELNQLVSDNQALFEVVLNSTETLIHYVNENASVCALNLEGENLDVLLDLEHWSHGRYSTIKNELSQLLDQITSGENDIPSEELNTILLKRLPELKDEFDGLVYYARYAAINSQIRVDIADLAIHALKNQGFFLNRQGYPSGDERGRLITELRNVEGSLITIQVDPIDDLETSNDLILISRDRVPKFQPELKERANAILNSLQKWGLQVGQIQNSPRPAQPPSLDSVNFIMGEVDAQPQKVFRTHEREN